MSITSSRSHRSWKYRIRDRGSSALETLEAAWEKLREIDARIPVAVLTLVDSRSRHVVRGYFANSTWRKRKGSAHEIAVSPRLIGDPPELLCTMMACSSRPGMAAVLARHATTTPSSFAINASTSACAVNA